MSLFGQEVRIFLEFPKGANTKSDLSYLSSGFLCIPDMPFESRGKYWFLDKVRGWLSSPDLCHKILGVFHNELEKTGLELSQIDESTPLCKFFSNINADTVANAEDPQLPILLNRLQLLNSLIVLLKDYKTEEEVLVKIKGAFSQLQKRITEVLSAWQKSLSYMFPPSIEIESFSRYKTYLEPPLEGGATPEEADIMSGLDAYSVSSRGKSVSILLESAHRSGYVKKILDLGANPRSLLPRYNGEESFDNLVGADDVVSAILANYKLDSLFNSDEISKSIVYIIEAGGSFLMTVFNFVVSILKLHFCKNMRAGESKFNFLADINRVYQFNIDNLLEKICQVCDEVYMPIERRTIIMSAQLKRRIFPCFSALVHKVSQFSVLAAAAKHHPLSRLDFEATNASQLLLRVVNRLVALGGISLTPYYTQLSAGETIPEPHEQNSRMQEILLKSAQRIETLPPGTDASVLLSVFAEYVSCPTDSDKFMKACLFAENVYKETANMISELYGSPDALLAVTTVCHKSSTQAAFVLFGQVLCLHRSLNPGAVVLAKEACEMIDHLNLVRLNYLLHIYNTKQAYAFKKGLKFYFVHIDGKLLWNPNVHSFTAHPTALQGKCLYALWMTIISQCQELFICLLNMGVNVNFSTPNITTCVKIFDLWCRKLSRTYISYFVDKLRASIDVDESQKAVARRKSETGILRKFDEFVEIHNLGRPAHVLLGAAEAESDQEDENGDEETKSDEYS